MPEPKAQHDDHPSPDRYRPIGDYGLIGDGHGSALVSSAGSIDWCCMPRFDSSPVFGRLLDAERGGHCSIEVPGGVRAVERRYVPHTLVLATTLTAATGAVRVTDCFTVHDDGARRPHRQLLRVIDGLDGQVELNLTVSPRFDYGGVRPWLRRSGPRLVSAIGGDDALVVSAGCDLEIRDLHDLVGSFRVTSGERLRLSITYVAPEDLDSGLPAQQDDDELDARLEETVAWWRRWSARLELSGGVEPLVERSALVLKALVHAPTGAVVAAPTTSLPESLGGPRNWDYRYSWIRDAQFTVRALTEFGCREEADGFRRFIERTAAGGAESLQVMYGIGGERRLTELEMDLDGYCGSRPVRVGNAASEQLQLDVYGYLLDLAWRWHERGRTPDDDYWRFLVTLVERAADLWDQPDCGIWEMRGKPQHFVHSKVMCWATLDRGLRLADVTDRRGPLGRWRRVRHEIRQRVEDEGVDRQRDIFVQAFGSTELDSALLLLPAFDFVGWTDERMLRTTDAIADELDDHGLLRRYRQDDGLPGQEGAFVACTFWLAECLARQGRQAEAKAAFARAEAAASDLGLFSEEVVPSTGQQLGNFPQGLSHLSHVAAAVALAPPDPAGNPS